MKRKSQSHDAFQKRRKIQEKVSSVLSPSISLTNNPNQSDAVFKEIRASTIPRQSRLLALPAELRNNIYTFALVNTEPVDIDSSCNEPGLLLVNRQIRAEARKIYYTSNQFFVVIQDCDDDLLHKFAMHCKGLNMTENIPILLRVNPAKNWANLQKWCERIWKDESTGPNEHRSEDAGICTVIVAAYKIARQHRDSGRSWSECALALENLKAVAEKLDPGWV